MLRRTTPPKVPYHLRNRTGTGWVTRMARPLKKGHRRTTTKGLVADLVRGIFA